MNEMSQNFIHKLVTDEPLEMNHVHFLITPHIEKFRDFSAHVIHLGFSVNNKLEYS